MIYGLPAHGVFGPYDEILFIVALIIFAVLVIAPLVMAWARKQNPAMPLPNQSSTDKAPTDNTKRSSAGDYYRLD